MKTRKFESTEERSILTALIVHDGVINSIVSHLGTNKAPFKNKWSNLIYRWCTAYFTKYQKAPRKMVQTLFQKYSQGEVDENSVQIVEAFLSTLSSDYVGVAEEINEKYITDLASNFFEKIRLESMAESITDAIGRDDLDEARVFFQAYQPVSFAESSWANPFHKQEVLSTLRFYEEDRNVIHFPGALGEFLDGAMERGGFVALAAPEKKGKSYWLGEVVWQALRQRRRVLYYVLGDMSKEQVKHRLYRRATLRPYRKRMIRFPVKISKNQKDENGVLTAEVSTEEREREGLTVHAIHKAIVKLQTMTASKDLRLKLLCEGASIVSASQIETDIKNFSAQGWVPDVVVIDYADLLASEEGTGKLDYRHQINETWKILRRISLDYNSLVVTATQTAARGYDSWVIRKKDFSEDKRKNAHVTAMIGINQTNEEKPKGIYRLNYVFLRDGEWSDTQVVWTAGNLALACPCLKSAL